jgi:hypothetical protein
MSSHSARRRVLKPGTIELDQELSNAVRGAAAMFNTALKNATAAGLKIEQISHVETEGGITTEPAKLIRLDDVRRSYK